MSLHCAKCGAPHDFDKAPDTGECGACAGPLVEHAAEAAAVAEGPVRAMATLVGDGLAAVAIARGRAPKGVN